MATPVPRPGPTLPPTQFGFRDWWQVLRRGFAKSQADNVSILAGGVAFFAFLAVFPTPDRG